MNANYFFGVSWLHVMGFFFLFYGAALLFFCQTSLFDFLFEGHINPRWEVALMPLDERRYYQESIYGLVSFARMALGVVILFQVRHGLLERKKWAWYFVATGVLVWFLCDTIVSVYFGVGINLLLNSAIFVMSGLPFVFMKRKCPF